MSDDYTKKLERRIHNQRVALRENWMIVEMRRKEYCGTLRPLKSKWWDLVHKKQKEINRLRVEVERYKDAILDVRESVVNRFPNDDYVVSLIDAHMDKLQTDKEAV